MSTARAATAIAVLEAAGEQARGEIDVAEFNRTLKGQDPLADQRASDLKRRSKGIQTNHEVAKRDFKDGKVDGPGPWTPEEERPGKPCTCKRTFPFCTTCRAWLADVDGHECGPAAIQKIPLGHPHRHCDICPRPAPEPGADCKVKVVIDGQTWRMTVNGSHLVVPVARIEEVTMQRRHLGWACNDPKTSGSHYEQVFSRQPAPSTWPTIEVASKHKRTKPKAVAFDEQRDSDAQSDGRLAEAEDDEQRGSVEDFLRQRRRW